MNLRHAGRSLSLSLLLFWLVATTCTRADTITLSTTRWCPFVCDLASDKPGIVIELTSRAFALKGHQVNYVMAPLARSIHSVKNNMTQGFAAITPFVLPEFIYPHESVFNTQTCVFTPNSSRFKFKGFKGQSYPGVRLGVIRGGKFGDGLEEAFTSRTVLSGDNVILREMRMLLRGRLDAVIEERHSIAYAIKESSLRQRYFRVAGCLDEVGIYVAFPPGQNTSLGYAKQLSDGLLQIKRSGGRLRVIRKYLDMKF